MDGGNRGVVMLVKIVNAVEGLVLNRLYGIG